MLIAHEARRKVGRDELFGSLARQARDGREPRERALNAVLQDRANSLRIVEASNADADIGTIEHVVGQRRAAGAAEVSLDETGRSERRRLTARPAQLVLAHACE